jgi:hypothetical protein
VAWKAVCMALLNPAISIIRSTSALQNLPLPTSVGLAEEKFQMPYTISVENQVVRCVMTGRITPEDLVALMGESKNYEENVEVVPHRITDLTGVEELALHYPDISALAEKRGQRRFPNAFKSAIIARDALHLGYARMYQNLNKNPQMVIRIFPEVAPALEWIASTSPLSMM